MEVTLEWIYQHVGKLFLEKQLADERAAHLQSVLDDFSDKDAEEEPQATPAPTKKPSKPKRRVAQ